MHYLRAPLTRGVVVLAACILAGCGGASGPGGLPALSATRVTPNYYDALEGAYHWPQRAITVCVESDAELRGAAEEAARLWESRTGGLLTLSVSDSPRASIRVDLAPAGSLGAGVVGVTDQLFTSGHRLVRAAIRLDAGLGRDARVQALAHELGHALGIDGHSPDSGDVMYYVSHLPVDVTLRDANTLRAIYGERGRSEPVAGDAPLTKARACTLKG